MSDIIKVGGAGDIQVDDVERDVGMARTPRLFHKSPLQIQRNQDTLRYGGHIIFTTNTAPVTSTGQGFTDTETIRFFNGAIQNVDMSAYIPSSLRPAGVLVRTLLDIKIDGAKVLATTFVEGYVNYGLAYDTEPENFHYLINQFAYSQSVDADNVTLRMKNDTFGMCPIVYRGSIPYIVYDINASWQNMKAVSGQYYIVESIFIVGLIE